MWGEDTESVVEMQSALALAGGAALFQLLNESASRACSGSATTRNSMPMPCDHQRTAAFSIFSRPLLPECCKSNVTCIPVNGVIDHAFNAAAFRRQITDGTFVPKLVALDQCARQADEETTVLAVTTPGLPSC